MNIKLLLALSTLSIGPFYASASGDEAVNCRTETVGKQAIYSGIASCNVDGYTLDRYILPTTLGITTITEYLGGLWRSCNAQVPFSHYESVQKTVCDYTPKASLYVDKQSRETYVNMSASDRDGHIVSTQAWLDGAPVTFGSLTLRSGYEVKIHNLKMRVKDDDGYVTERSAVIRVEPFVPCDDGTKRPICD